MKAPLLQGLKDVDSIINSYITERIGVFVNMVVDVTALG